MDESLEQLINFCLDELGKAYQGKYDPDRAEKSAALFLEVQLKLADYVSSVEFRARMAKSEVERVSAEKYFVIKNGSVDKKLSEAALEHSLAKDEDILKIKKDVIKNETEYKKWQYVMNSLQNGHIYFRSLAKHNM